MLDRDIPGMGDYSPPDEPDEAKAIEDAQIDVADAADGIVGDLRAIAEEEHDAFFHYIGGDPDAHAFGDWEGMWYPVWRDAKEALDEGKRLQNAKEKPKMDAAEKLSTAEDEIVILQERLAAAISANERHEKQRTLDSESIDALEQQLKLPRAEIQNGEYFIKLTQEQHKDLIRQENSVVKSELVVLQGEYDELTATNTHLHSQVDALKSGGQDDDSLLAEQREGLQAAENYRKEMEVTNEALTDTIASMSVIENCLRNDICDLKYKIDQEAAV